MFGTNKQLLELLTEQKKSIDALNSELKAIQTQLRFIMDDTDVMRQDLRNLKRGIHDNMEEQHTGNWKVERF